MIDAAVAAVLAGRPIIVPVDTVYGLATSAFDEEGVRRLARLKGRDERQPVALVAADLATLLDCLPELGARGEEALLRAVLPGPYTLVVGDPAGRFAWLGGARAGTVGVRVPAFSGVGAELLARVRTLAATSANVHGGPDARRLTDVPEALRLAAAAELDGGELPGMPSTVVDLTGPAPVVLREGAVPAAEALARLAAAGPGA